jgi:hypothetical protein
MQKFIEVPALAAAKRITIVDTKSVSVQVILVTVILVIRTFTTRAPVTHSPELKHHANIITGSHLTRSWEVNYRSYEIHDIRVT